MQIAQSFFCMTSHDGLALGSTPPRKGTLNSTTAPRFPDDGAGMIKVKRDPIEVQSAGMGGKD